MCLSIFNCLCVGEKSKCAYNVQGRQLEVFENAIDISVNY